MIYTSLLISSVAMAMKDVTSFDSKDIDDIAIAAKELNQQNNLL